MKLTSLFVGIGAALAAVTAPAAAQHQPMALGEQNIDLAPRASHASPAFCLERALDVPGRGLSLAHVSGGAAKVCAAGTCVPLQDAIARDWIRVSGTGGYHVTFENLTDKHLEVRVRNGAIVSDVPTAPAKRPMITLPIDQHDGLIQYKLWRERDQIGPLITVSLVERDGIYTLTGKDGHGAPVEIERIAEENLGRILAALALDPDVALIVRATLAPDKLRALLHDVRLQAAKAGLVAVVNMRREDFAALARMGDVTVGSAPVRIESSARSVEAQLQLTAASADPVPARAIVEFERPVQTPLRTRVGERVRDAVERLRGAPAKPMLDTAADVRSAVRDEMSALRRTLSKRGSLRLPADAVWVVIGDAARGYLMVRVSFTEAPWAA